MSPVRFFEKTTLPAPIIATLITSPPSPVHQQLRAAERIPQEHRDGDRADAAGDGGDPARGPQPFADGGEVDVADRLGGAVGLGDAVDADVEDDRALPHIVRPDQTGLAD